jgi:hypothetical protein
MTRQQAREIHRMVLALEDYTRGIKGASNIHRIIFCVHVSMHVGKLGTLARLLSAWMLRVATKELARMGVDVKNLTDIEKSIKKAHEQQGDPNLN